jgi:hypothetical protein
MTDTIAAKVSPFGKYYDLETATGIHACARCPGDKDPLHAHSRVKEPKPCVSKCVCFVCKEHTNTDEVLVTCIGTKACHQIHSGAITLLSEAERKGMHKFNQIIRN